MTPLNFHTQPARTSGRVVVAFIASLFGIVFALCGGGFLPSVAAVVLAHLSLAETQSGVRGGHGLNIAALTLGYFGLFISALFWIVWFAV